MRPILYAEDSEDEVFLMKRAFRQVRTAATLVVVPNGRSAIEYLAGANRYADRERYPLPALILLDVKMPYESGLEVVCWIRSQPHFNDTPVFMLTSSSQEKDIAIAYSNGANGYLVKPTNLETFRQMVDDVVGYATKGAIAQGWMNVRGGVPRPEGQRVEGR